MTSYAHGSFAIRCIVLCFALGGASTPAAAVDMRWTNTRGDGSGTFSVASNWTSANPAVSPPPGTSDVARLGRSTSSVALAYTVNFTNDPTNLRLVVEDDNVTFDLNGRGYRATSPIAVILGTEFGRTGQLTVVDGNLNTPTTADIQIATVAGGAGVFTVGAGGLVFGFPEVEVGVNGNGIFNVANGGDVIADAVQIGKNAGSTGTATITGAGSSLNAAEIDVGGAGTGSLNVLAGAIVESTAGIIGDVAGSTGAVTVDGVGSRWSLTGQLKIGANGDATLSITAGSVVQNTSAFVGGDFGGGIGDGEVLVSGPGSRWTNSGDVQVGFGGEGTLDITDEGQVHSSGAVHVNGLAVAATVDVTDGGELHSSGGSAGVSIFGDSGAITVSGAGSLWMNSGQLELGGNTGHGTLNITAGGVVHNTSSFVGVLEASVPGIGEVIVTGAGSLWTNTGDVQVGFGGQGLLNVSNGGQIRSNGAVLVGGEHSTINVLSNGQLQSNGGAVGFGIPTKSGTVNVLGSGAVWMNSGALAVGSFTSGTMTIANGGQVQSKDATLAGDLQSDRGDVTVAGAGASWTIDGRLSIGGDAATGEDKGIGALRIQPGGSVSVAQFTILFANDELRLEGGALSSPDISIRSGGAFVWTSGTLHAGIYRGSLVVPSGGILAPGNAVGSTEVRVDYSQVPGSTLQIDIGGATPAQHDRVTVLGNAALGGNLELALLNNYLPSPTTTLTIFDSRSISGAFTNVANGHRLTTADGLGSFLVSYGSGSPFDDDQIVLSNFVRHTNGDFDLDGDVDGNDFLVWQRGDSPNPLSPADLDDWKANFGADPASASNAVPEPSTAALFVPVFAAATTLFATRRRRAASVRTT